MGLHPFRDNNLPLAFVLNPDRPESVFDKVCQLDDLQMSVLHRIAYKYLEKLVHLEFQLSSDVYKYRPAKALFQILC